MQRLFAVLALLPALLFAQIPELVQQYRQRIGGAADELNVVVRNFDEDSRRSGYDRAGALGVMKKNPERLVREQGQRMEEYVTRLDRLNAQQAVLANGSTFKSKAEQLRMASTTGGKAMINSAGQRLLQ